MMTVLVANLTTRMVLNLREVIVNSQPEHSTNMTTTLGSTTIDSRVRPFGHSGSTFAVSTDTFELDSQPRKASRNMILIE